VKVGSQRIDARRDGGEHCPITVPRRGQPRDFLGYFGLGIMVERLTEQDYIPPEAGHLFAKGHDILSFDN
jgi:hypothetical protein